MNTLPAQPPSPNDNDEIDLAKLGAALKRRSRLIAVVTAGSLLITAVITLRQKPTWEGEFQIVLSESGSSKLSQLGSNPLLAGITGSLSGGGKDTLETQVQILQSPSVLKPVFDFVRSSKQRAGENVDKLRYSAWLKGNVKVKLEKGTSVLNISYTDTDKYLIAAVMGRISTAYQTYSAKNQKRSVQQSIDWAASQIERLKPLAIQATEQRDRFALDHGIQAQGSTISGDKVDLSSLLSSNGSSGSSSPSLSSLLQSAKGGTSSTSHGESFGNPYAQLAGINQQLIERQQIFTAKDPIIQELIRKRNALKLYIDRTAGGSLAAPAGLPLTQSQSQAILIQYQQLNKIAERQESTLTALESALLNFQLEKAKQIDPWELISTPTLLDTPVSPKKSRNMALGLLAGLVLGSGAALVVDRRSGKVYAIDELKASLPYPLLAELHQGVSQSNQQTLQLLAQGALEAPHSVALIPIGMAAAAAQPIATSLQSALREDNHSAEVLCSSDLLATRHCGIQILLTAPGAATRSELAALVQQLQLQGTPVAGWLLLQPSPQKAGDV